MTYPTAAHRKTPSVAIMTRKMIIYISTLLNLQSLAAGMTEASAGHYDDDAGGWAAEDSRLV
jgi:hypothetical protein